ncbi:unannotated protein [freshwater metagenome]|uniref:Unannotated protein n=1 Tax=freshwater metagenome TaxID=449393 RepID=A0A6J7IXU0_9ZZZZ
MSALESAINAVALRGTSGKPVAIPVGGLFRISSSIASKRSPGCVKISPGSKFGVISELFPAAAKVRSSR